MWYVKLNDTIIPTPYQFFSDCLAECNLPKPKLKKASVYQERSEATEVKPTYYYETIERMFPEESYLDVFSAKPCNSKWKTLFNKDEEEKNNEAN